MRRAWTRKDGEAGQATVEFAIIIPLLLLLVVGIIEFGKAFNYWIDLNHLANEGARWAAVEKVPPNNAAPAPHDLKAYLVDQIGSNELRQAVAPPGISGVGGSNVQVCYTPSLPNQTAPQVGDAVTVSIAAPYSFPFVSSVAGVVAGLFGGNGDGVGDVTLRAKSTMRLEQAPVSSAEWVQCKPPPAAPLITSSPPNPDAASPGSDTGTATFTFSGGNGLDYFCSLDNAAYTKCDSPITYTDLSAGGASHVFRVRAHDNDQNQTSEVTIYRWIIN